MAAAKRGTPKRATQRDAAPKRRGRRDGASKRSASRRVAPPLEHRVLMTATLCLLAFGAVMIYSASSPVGALSDGGSGAGEFLRYVVFVVVGLGIMYFLERHGMKLLTERLRPARLLGARARRRVGL